MIDEPGPLALMRRVNDQLDDIADHLRVLNFLIRAALFIGALSGCIWMGWQFVWAVI